MKTSTIKVLGTLVAALFAATAPPASAQLSTTAKGPYYATPSWDQKLTNNRFVILANWNAEAVLDRETGLVWERSPDTALQTRQGAMLRCMSLHAGGRLGWRLPGIQELASLVDPTVPSPGPTLPPGHPFPTVESADYWSDTAVSYAPSAWWVVRFDAGDINIRNNLGASRARAWCVRGGQGTDLQ